MQICIDVQSAITLNTGVGRYTRQLVEHLGVHAEADTLRAFYFDFQGNAAPFHANGVTMSPVRWCPGRIAQNAWKRLHWPPFECFAGKADLYHFPNFILPPLRHGKSVVTIHDVSFMRMSEYTETKNLSYLTQKILRTVRETDAIITDSKFSASEIESLLGVSPDKITAIYPGISSHFQRPENSVITETCQRLGITRPYLLTVCTLEPRKNLPFMVDVFEQLKDFDGDWVLAGMAGWKYEPILERIRNSPAASRIRHLNFVSDADLPALYAGAELFVFPSFYEGFGFPPLEAMACGTPVVSSTGGSLGEVLRNGAICIDTFDVDRWLAEIQKLLTGSAIRASLIEAGSAQVAEYTWAPTAAETWKLYRRLAS